MANPNGTHCFWEQPAELIISVSNAVPVAINCSPDTLEIRFKTLVIRKSNILFHACH